MTSQPQRCRPMFPPTKPTYDPSWSAQAVTWALSPAVAANEVTHQQLGGSSESTRARGGGDLDDTPWFARTLPIDCGAFAAVPGPGGPSDRKRWRSDVHMSPTIIRRSSIGDASASDVFGCVLVAGPGLGQNLRSREAVCQCRCRQSPRKPRGPIMRPGPGPCQVAATSRDLGGNTRQASHPRVHSRASPPGPTTLAGSHRKGMVSYGDVLRRGSRSLAAVSARGRRDARAPCRGRSGGPHSSLRRVSRQTPSVGQSGA